jgi:hypothetical protein
METHCRTHAAKPAFVACTTVQTPHGYVAVTNVPGQAETDTLNMQRLALTDVGPLLPRVRGSTESVALFEKLLFGASALDLLITGPLACVWLATDVTHSDLEAKFAADANRLYDLACEQLLRTHHDFRARLRFIESLTGASHFERVRAPVSALTPVASKRNRGIFVRYNLFLYRCAALKRDTDAGQEWSVPVDWNPETTPEDLRLAGVAIALLNAIRDDAWNYADQLAPATRFVRAASVVNTNPDGLKNLTMDKLLLATPEGVQRLVAGVLYATRITINYLSRMHPGECTLVSRCLCRRQQIFRCVALFRRGFLGSSTLVFSRSGSSWPRLRLRRQHKREPLRSESFAWQT